MECGRTFIVFGDALINKKVFFEKEKISFVGKVCSF